MTRDCAPRAAIDGGPCRKNDRPAAIFLRRRNVQSALRNARLAADYILRHERERDTASLDVRLSSPLDSLSREATANCTTRSTSMKTRAIFCDIVPFTCTRDGPRAPYTQMNDLVILADSNSAKGLILLPRVGYRM